MAKYVELREVYAYYEPLASHGPSDESIRSILDQAEAEVEAHLESLGWDLSSSVSGRALQTLKKLIILKTLSDALLSPIGTSGTHIDSRIADQFRDRFESLLGLVERLPALMEGAERRYTPNVPRFPE